MAYTRRDIRGGAISTTLASGINSGDASCTIASATGWPDGSAGDFFIVIDRGTATEEKIRCATRTGTTIAFQTSGRGADGTAAAAHSSGAAAEHTVTAVDLDEANYTVTKTVGRVTTAGDLLVGDAANSLARLGIGTTGYPLVAGASTPSYSQLGTSGIADDAVTAAKIAADAVGSSEIATDAVGTAEIAASAVGTSELAATSVTTAKIAAAAVTEVELAASVAGNGLAGGAGTALSVGVDGSSIEISSDALRVKAAGITSAMILDGTIVAGDLASDAVTTVKVLDANVTTGKLANNAATFAKVAAENRPTVVQQGLAGNGIDTVATIGTVTITDPGYDIYVWGSICMAGLTSAVANYALSASVRGSTVSALVVPFISATISQSAGVPIKRTLAATGSNTVVLARLERWVSASGQMNVTVDAAFSYMEVWWVRAT